MAYGPNQGFVPPTNAASSGQIYINGVPFQGTITVGGHTNYGTNFQMTTTCDDHETDDSAIEYIDGEVVAYCINCEARIRLGRVPGGVNFLKIKEMLERLAAGDFAGELIADFAWLKESLRRDREALELAEQRVQTAELLLEQRGFFPA